MGFLNNYYINKTNLLNNIKIIRARLKPSTKICAVVKANAYGVGLKEVVSIIKDYVDYYAVANIDEALELRTLDNNKEILILGYVDLLDIREAVQNNLCVTIISKKYFVDLVNYLHDEKIKGLRVHIKINTGLNRFGLNIDEFEDCEKLLRDKSIEVVGCYTHFATKENDREFINEQFEKFVQVSRFLKPGIIKHCANSFASLNELDKQLDMVRVGFNLYGMEKNDFGLKPVVSIKSKIINILNLKAGETVGYDRTFTAANDMQIAVVPIGYADGFPRILSNKFKLFLSGRYVSVVGRICMDICFIDISGTSAKLGDAVEIMGENILTRNFSNILNTSSYEILLNFNKIRANRIIVTNDR